MDKMKPLNVLIACEESQEVCKAFRRRGHSAYSCDLEPCSGGHPEWHIIADAVDTMVSGTGITESWDTVHVDKWDLVIAHPPCTYLCNSGVRWFDDPRHPDRWTKLRGSITFFREFQKYGESGHQVAIENPIPHKFARDGFTDCATDWRFIPGIGEYSQIIQPWQFGHGEQKATCLWLFGLPELTPTKIVSGREQRIWKMAPGVDRTKERSKTFPGIAAAFASQWSPDLSNPHTQ